MLPLKEGRLVHEEEVVDELAVKVLIPVRRPQIEGIVWSIFAGGLNIGSSSEGLGISEVRLQRQSPPVGHLEGEEARVVVAVAYAGVKRSARCHLWAHRSLDCVHHGVS